MPAVSPTEPTEFHIQGRSTCVYQLQTALDRKIGNDDQANDDELEITPRTLSGNTSRLWPKEIQGHTFSDCSSSASRGLRLTTMGVRLCMVTLGFLQVGGTEFVSGWTEC